MNAETLAIIVAINQAAGMNIDDALNKAKMTIDVAEREVKTMKLADEKNEPRVKPKFGDAVIG